MRDGFDAGAVVVGWVVPVVAVQLWASASDGVAAITSAMRMIRIEASIPVQVSTRRKAARCGSLNFEMLGELQALRLIVRADPLAVKRVGPRNHLLVGEAADDLSVLQDEGHLARAHFQHCAASSPAR